MRESLTTLPVTAEVEGQGACRGPRRHVGESLCYIFSCIDLVITALGDVKGGLLAHTLAAQMGMVRFFLFC